MPSLSIGDAWQQAHIFVRREAALLIPLGLALIALPAILLEIAAPAVRPATAQTVEPWMLLAIPSGLATMLASLAIARLVLVSRASVGEALQAGAARLPTAILASLLIGVLFTLLILPVLPLFVGGAAAVAKIAPVIRLFLLLYMIALSVVLVHVSVRLLPVNAVIVSEAVGAVDAIRRSWAITRGAFWRLFGFGLLFLVTSAVASYAVNVAAGVVLVGGGRLIGAEALGTFLLAVIGGVVNALVSVYLVVMLAFIYAQLASGSPRSGI